jgi:hypothetical protein
LPVTNTLAYWVHSWNMNCSEYGRCTKKLGIFDQVGCEWRRQTLEIITIRQLLQQEKVLYYRTILLLLGSCVMPLSSAETFWKDGIIPIETALLSDLERVCKLPLRNIFHFYILFITSSVWLVFTHKLFFFIFPKQPILKRSTVYRAFPKCTPQTAFDSG